MRVAWVHYFGMVLHPIHVLVSLGAQLAGIGLHHDFLLSMLVVPIRRLCFWSQRGIGLCVVVEGWI